ncbi:MAG: hypothetical protein HY664_05440, partial [Chloroflexi bacterium]|nr:hypothetical protein [Chloroflexota bacterium]
MNRDTSPEVAIGANPDLAQEAFGALWRGSRLFWLVVAVLGILFALGIIGFLVRLSDGFADRTRWGYYAAVFSYLITTFQMAPLVSVGLRFTEAHWPRPLARASELFAVVGILNLLWFIPLLRLIPSAKGRQSIWFEWPLAPHLWDTLILGAVVFSGLALLYVNALPDWAAARDRDSGGKGRLWGRLALSWRGSPQQWRWLKTSLLLLGAFYFMGVILLHTLISSDFALSLVPEWKDSLFPAYHAVSGFQGGLAVVIVALFLLRRLGGLKTALGRDQFWCLGRILLAVTLIWFYFWWSGFIIFWYGRRPEERLLLELFMVGPYQLAFYSAFALNFLGPFLLLLWNPIRRSIWGPTLAASMILLGTLFDRIRIFAASFSVKGALEELPPTHWPQISDMAILVGGIAGAVLIYILATRLMPSLSLWAVTEGEHLKVERSFLRLKVRVLARQGKGTEGEEAFSEHQINRDLLSPVFGTPPWYWPAVGFLSLVLLAGIVAFGWLVNRGLGVTGLNRPVMWAFFITNFVFWVGISHAGVMISSILRLAQAEWRRPVTRAAEVLTV